MIIEQILTALGVSTIVSGIFLYFFQRAMKARDEKQEEIRRQNEELEKQSKAIMLGVQAMLRDRLLQGYKHYMAKGWADYDDRSNLENVWTQYHALGANGVMDDMRMEFRRLPTREGGPATPVEE